MSACHLTLKREATKPAAANVLQQQARFDDFITRYNTDRPHQALGMKVPGDVYTLGVSIFVLESYRSARHEPPMRPGLATASPTGP